MFFAVDSLAFMYENATLRIHSVGGRYVDGRTDGPADSGCASLVKAFPEFVVLQAVLMDILSTGRQAAVGLATVLLEPLFLGSLRMVLSCCCLVLFCFLLLEFCVVLFFGGGGIRDEGENALAVVPAWSVEFSLPSSSLPFPSYILRSSVERVVSCFRFI